MNSRELRGQTIADTLSKMDISLNGKGGVMGRVIPDDQLGDRNYAANALAFTAGSSLARSFSDGLTKTILIGQHYARCKWTAFTWNSSNPTCVYVDPVTNRNTEVPCWTRPPVNDHESTFAG